MSKRTTLGRVGSSHLSTLGLVSSGLSRLQPIADPPFRIVPLFLMPHPCQCLASHLSSQQMPNGCAIAWHLGTLGGGLLRDFASHTHTHTYASAVQWPGQVKVPPLRAHGGRVPGMTSSVTRPVTGSRAKCSNLQNCFTARPRRAESPPLFSSPIEQARCSISPFESAKRLFVVCLCIHLVAKVDFLPILFVLLS